MDLESELVEGSVREVKSKVIAKYSSVMPTNYMELKTQTNLKFPPSNWFKEAQKWHWCIPEFCPQKGFFSSKEMADSYLDYVGEVDVISDATNIKKLLKIPFSKSQVSMMVHRVGKTLLLDDFDIHKYLLLTSEKEWEWLRKFFVNHVLESIGKEWSLAFKESKPTVESLYLQSLETQFLYQSIVTPTAGENPLDSVKLLPDPACKINEAEENSMKNDEFSKFAHNVLWSFEDIKMLIGSNMPIFGNGVKPCVSLRLHDMSKPINVLTGLDYWLDNLMCNVPEVMMCYHLDFIVQKYECIKTEDLPMIEGSKFSPKVVRDIAQNILSFLKSNATKPGHTYWLFKGENDDVVKLYDLTSLCPEIVEDPGQNPFTVPVAILLYRVACNLINLGKTKDSPVICSLLKMCISLLDKNCHYKLVSQAHFLLSDLYVPFDLDPTSFCSNSEEEKPAVPPEPNVSDSYSLDISELCINNMSLNMDDCGYVCNLGDNLNERCLTSLEHVYQGLESLKHTSSSDNSSPLQPFSPVPMPNYVDNSGMKDRTEGHTYKFLKGLIHLDRPEGKEHPKSVSYLRAYLYQKGLLSCMALGESFCAKKKLGLSLKYTDLSLSFYNAMVTITGETTGVVGLKGCILGLMGDIYFHTVHNWVELESILSDYHCELEFPFFEVVENVVPDVSSVSSPRPVTKEDYLKKSIHCYEKALSCNPCCEKVSLYRRLGNVYNELGVVYMNEAMELGQEEQVNRLVKSQEYLSSGIKYFEIIDDNINLSLLHSNVGRLHRLYAHVCNTIIESQEVTEDQKLLYRKAIDQYQKALHVLGKREKFPCIWDSVTWELSTTYFTFASLLQDYPGLPSPDLDKEVSDVFHRSLSHCQDLVLKSNGDPKQTIYQYRAATIHHRLASLYHHNFRKASGIECRTRSYRLADYHYLKSINQFTALEEPDETLKVFLERYALLEQNLAGLKNKEKQKQLYCKLMNDMVDQKKTIENLQNVTAKINDVSCLLKVYVQRCQMCLLNLMKVTSTMKNSSHSDSELSDLKVAYGRSLKVDLKGDTSSIVQSTVAVLCSVEKILLKLMRK